MSNKLKIQIPEEVLDFSHTYGDIEANMTEVKVGELLLDRTKLNFLLNSIDLVIIPRQPETECQDEEYQCSEGAYIGRR